MKATVRRVLFGTAIWPVSPGLGERHAFGPVRDRRDPFGQRLQKPVVQADSLTGSADIDCAVPIDPEGA
jgi:hypothetical protein